MNKVKKKFFDMEINMEEGMGNPYRPDNFFPILILHYLPFKFAKRSNSE